MSSPFSRAIVIVMDSVGVGELPDAASYGDQGSNTLGNIAARVRLRLPELTRLGIWRCLAPAPNPPEGGSHEASQPNPPEGGSHEASQPNPPEGGSHEASAPNPPEGGSHETVAHPAAAFGRMAERSPGKDSVTGHWELMGLVRDQAFPLFPHGFPPDVMRAFEARIERGTLGNKPASGTVIIEELGPEHLRTGSPIIYTSGDSVFQIAAHEDVIPVPELYRECAAAYDIAVRGLGMGRVIARPFVGRPGSFTRTANRRDFSMPPPADTLLDKVKAAGLPVVGIGKIEDLFAGHGLTRAVHTVSDDDGMNHIMRAVEDTRAGLIVANLVDFDTLYGHRNDVNGYAANLERFDARLSQLLPRLRESDLLVLTADHGNDPTTASTDHAREYVPVLTWGARVRHGVDLGVRSTFADLGQTLAEVFGVGAMPFGRSFLGEISM